MTSFGRLVRPELVQPVRRDLGQVIDIFGAGRVVRALMTVAALANEARRFRVWSRHEARAELLRVHLADLPALDVDIHVSETPPPALDGPLVLAMGVRTSRTSRQARKDALFAENMAAIEAFWPALEGRTAIVVTNPCTAIVARLRERGVDALGIGVMNDQLRFERDADPAFRLAGAHNPFELAFGALGRLPDDDLAFTREAYRELTNRQDRQRPLLDPDGLLRRASPALHETAWRDLGDVHDRLDVARRWYARQRIASRYLENGVACGRAILALCDLLCGRPLARPDITVETALRLGPQEPAVVMGWPLDSATALPRALALGPASIAPLESLAGRYAVAAPRGSGTEADASACLVAKGVATVRCIGVGLQEILPDIVPLATISDPAGPLPRADDKAASLAVTITDDPSALLRSAGPALGPDIAIPQHRGKNAFEHRDIILTPLAGDRRLARFPVSGAAALIDDASRQVLLAVPPGPGRRDELRKLIRDQMLTPAWSSAGAWVLHAGLVSSADANLLLLGGSGAGKTTAALHVLCGGRGGYGASERVLVLAHKGVLMALGVPESLTVFPGSLRGLEPFAARLAGRDLQDDWRRDRKLRLSRDEVVAGLSSWQIPEPVPITHLALLHYDGDLAGDVSISTNLSAAERARALHDNDLTTADDVRAAWLGWFQPQRNSQVENLVMAQALPASAVTWRRAEALADALVALAAGHPSARLRNSQP